MMLSLGAFMTLNSYQQKQQSVTKVLLSKEASWILTKMPFEKVIKAI